jgi:hypothetical protein
MRLTIRPHRTGPIGRLARLVLAGVYGVSLASILGPTLSARFHNPQILSQPTAWFLHAVMLLTFVLLAGAVGTAFGGAASRRAWQAGAFGAAVVAVVIAEILTISIHGTEWGSPVADAVWWFDAVMLAEGLVATLLAIVIGLPGCEIGVWPWFISRARGRPALPEEGLACVVGLHLLDAWESQRRVTQV